MLKVNTLQSGTELIAEKSRNYKPARLTSLFTNIPGCLCAFIISILLFLVLNYALWWRDSNAPFTNSAVNAQHFDFSGTVGGLKGLPSPPQVLLMGSSLLLYPSWIVDYGTNTKCGDPNHYHFCDGLESACRRAGSSRKLRVYDLSIGGAIKSDDYFLLSKYVLLSNKPAWIIVDCAPRSFYDSGMTKSKDSPIFKYLTNLQDFSKFETEYFPAVSDKLDFLLSKIFFMWCHRRYFQDQILLAEMNASSFFNKILAPNAMVPGDNNRTVCTNEGKSTNNSRTRKILNSLTEYSNRYRGICIPQIQEQMHFFEHFLTRCSDSSINVLVVNMPLTKANRNLLTVEFQKDFNKAISTIIAQHKARYLDLSNDHEFTNDDFADSAHLNAIGGRKLFSRIANLKLFDNL